MFELNNIFFSYGANTVIEDVSLTFEKGCFYGIIGPNGSGKTTLIDLLSGHLRPERGTIRMSGVELGHHKRKDLARRIALVPQDFRINFPYTCQEVVMMGRYPHIPRFSRPGRSDRAMVSSVLARTALSEFSYRLVNQLSGGERQRVVFARSLAQDTPVLLLDEATANLDMHHTIELLDLVVERVAIGALVIAVMQDVNLAAMYCDRLVCMRNGKVVTHGVLEDVLTEELLQSVFQVKTRVAHSDFSNTRQVTFRRGAAL